MGLLLARNILPVTGDAMAPCVTSRPYHRPPRSPTLFVQHPPPHRGRDGRPRRRLRPPPAHGRQSAGSRIDDVNAARHVQDPSDGTATVPSLPPNAPLDERAHEHDGFCWDEQQCEHERHDEFGELCERRGLEVGWLDSTDEPWGQ